VGLSDLTLQLTAASAQFSGVVTTGIQTFAGDKTATGVWIYQPSTNYSFPTTGMPFTTVIGRVAQGSVIAGYDDVGAIAYRMRGYATSNIQLELLKGGVSTSIHGNSSNWYQGYNERVTQFNITATTNVY